MVVRYSESMIVRYSETKPVFTCYFFSSNTAILACLYVQIDVCYCLEPGFLKGRMSE